MTINSYMLKSCYIPIEWYEYVLTILRWPCVDRDIGMKHLPKGGAHCSMYDT